MSFIGRQVETLKNTTQSLPLPVGSLVGFLSTNMPQGFIICDGRTIQATDPLAAEYYPQLVEHLNPGQDTATVPDLRGRFLRGHSVDNSVDTAGPRSPGSVQADEFKSHTHNTTWKFDSVLGGGGTGSNANGGGANSYVMTSTATGGGETRPKNVAVVWGIKASNTVVQSRIYNEADPTSLFASLLNWTKSPMVPQGRLTLTSNTPVLATNTLHSGSILYYTPYQGNRLTLYNTTEDVWNYYYLTELSIPISGLTDNIPYDVFVYDDGTGSLALELVSWGSELSRSVDLVRQDGVLVRSGSKNKLYIGCIFAESDVITLNFTSTQLAQPIKNVGILNAYNRVFGSGQNRASGNLSFSTTEVVLYNGNLRSIIDPQLGNKADFYAAGWGYSSGGGTTIVSHVREVDNAGSIQGTSGVIASVSPSANLTTNFSISSTRKIPGLLRIRQTGYVIGPNITTSDSNMIYSIEY